MAYVKKMSSKKYSNKKKTYPSKKYTKVPKGLAKAVKSVMLKNIETKKAVGLNPQSTRGTQLENGKMLYLDNAPFLTTQGTDDPNDNRLGCRVGDEVIPVGLSIRFMTALNVRQTSARFRWMLIKHSPSDLPTDSTLFQFASFNVNKQLCPVDTERFTIIAQKTFTINSGNRATGTATSGQTAVTEAAGVVNAGTYYASPDVDPLGFTQRLVNVWIPGSKFGSKLRYQDSSSSLKSWSYSSIIIGYNNYAGTVPSDLGLNRGAYIGVMDDYISQFYFKDA